MTVTTIAAGYLNITTNYLPAGNYLLAGASAIMIILVVVVIIDAILAWSKIKPKKESNLDIKDCALND
jgi:carbon starvation protein